MRIIQQHEKEFKTTPSNGWVGNEFFLISGGNGIKRVWLATDPTLPAFSYTRPGAPKRKASSYSVGEAVKKALAAETDDPNVWSEAVELFYCLSEDERIMIPVALNNRLCRAMNEHKLWR